MNVTRLATVFVSLALLAPAAAALPDIGLPGTPTSGPELWLVGFYALPSDRSTYAGERVVAVDEDLAYFLVETRNRVGLQARAKLDDSVRYVEPDASEHRLLLTPDDPLYTNSGHYGVKTTKIDLAWDKTVGSTAVRLSVIDSGIRKTHEDAGGTRILQGYDFKNGDTNPEDSSGCSYHGSHTAGTAAATINNGKGIAGVAQVMIDPIKIFHNGFFGCGTTTTAIVNAFKYTADQGDHVSSNSWGGGSSSTSINDAMKYALGKGVTIVGAAGNSGPCTNCVGQPWKDMGTTAGVVVVSCTTSSDSFCSFSSEGPQVDVAAPGSSILSIDGSADTKYKSMSGTSMSTPHVAGVAALVKTVYSSASPSTVEGKIKNSADNLGLSADRQGAGRLDGQGAVA